MSEVIGCVETWCGAVAGAHIPVLERLVLCVCSALLGCDMDFTVARTEFTMRAWTRHDSLGCC